MTHELDRWDALTPEERRALTTKEQWTEVVIGMLAAAKSDLIQDLAERIVGRIVPLVAAAAISHCAVFIENEQGDDEMALDMVNEVSKLFDADTERD